MHGTGKNNLVIERENLRLFMNRTFNAPRQVVWDAFKDPAKVAKWWSMSDNMVVEEMDFKAGGKWRYVETSEDGTKNVFYGEFKVVDEPNTISYTFEYEPWAGHVMVDTLTFTEEDGKTTISGVTTFDNLEDLDGMVGSGMEKGAVISWDKLQKLVEQKN